MKHLYTLLLFTAMAITANAQWNTDTLVRNAICTAANTQYNAEICTDGYKGAIMAWNDLRTNPSAIYVQRIDSNGVTKWGPNGVQANTTVASIGATDTKIIEDGSGGAFVVYDKIIVGGQEQIYAQHFDKLGQKLWGADGIVINNAGDARLGGPSNNQSLAVDGSGGVYITWYQYVSGGSDIMVQHLDFNGTKLWGSAQGLKISVSATFHYVSRIVNTGNGTAAIAYYDNTNLIVQRLSAAGAKLFGNNGVQVVNTLAYSENLTFNIGYFSGYIFIAWTDNRAVGGPHNSDIYAQKLDINGNVKWQANGMPVDTSTNHGLYPEILSDKNGGFYASYGYGKAFVQRVDKMAKDYGVQQARPLQPRPTSFTSIYAMMAKLVSS